jgi:hypothetical protein
LIEVIRNSLNQVHGCFYPYRNLASGEIEVETIFHLLKTYWKEVKKAFPEAWGLKPHKSRLMHGAGIKAMGNLMDRILGVLSPKDPELEDKIRESILKIKPVCHWTEQTLGIAWGHSD